MKNWKKLSTTFMVATMSIAVVNGSATFAGNQLIHINANGFQIEKNKETAMEHSIKLEKETRKNDLIMVVPSKFKSPNGETSNVVPKQSKGTHRDKTVNRGIKSSSIASRGEHVVRGNAFKVEATAYTISREDTGKIDGITFTETKVKEGRTVAVDPNVIPLGSILRIEYVDAKGNVITNDYVAEDIGGGINGKEIDIYFDSKEKAIDFGRKTAVVTIVKKGTWKRNHHKG